MAILNNIQANDLQANSLDTTEIKADNLNATEIKANKLDASKIKIGDKYYEIKVVGYGENGSSGADDTITLVVKK